MNNWIFILILVIIFIAFLYVNNLRIKMLISLKEGKQDNTGRNVNYVLLFFSGVIWFFFYEVFDTIKGRLSLSSDVIMLKAIALIVMLATLFVIKLVYHKNIYNEKF